MDCKIEKVNLDKLKNEKIDEVVDKLATNMRKGLQQYSDEASLNKFFNVVNYIANISNSPLEKLLESNNDVTNFDFENMVLDYAFELASSIGYFKSKDIVDRIQNETGEFHDSSARKSLGIQVSKILRDNYDSLDTKPLKTYISKDLQKTISSLHEFNKAPKYIKLKLVEEGVNNIDKLQFNFLDVLVTADIVVDIPLTKREHDKDFCSAINYVDKALAKIAKSTNKIHSYNGSKIYTKYN